MTIKWQRHPSTRTGHAFKDEDRWSLCKRETRTNDGEEFDNPGTFGCSRCVKALEKLRKKPDD